MAMIAAPNGMWHEGLRGRIRRRLSSRLILSITLALAATLSLAPALTAAAAARVWAVVASADAGASPALGRVTCVTSTDCWAVGSTGNTGTAQPLIEHSTGANWVIISGPSVAAPSGLYGVTCTSARICWAVGRRAAGSNAQALIEHYSGGQWAQSPSPTVAGGIDSLLREVTCSNTYECWAVGSYSDGTTTHALLERYSGRRWVVVAAPMQASNAGDELLSVKCVASTDCWAAGDYSVSGGSRSLIEHYDGNSWSIVPSPNPSDVAWVGAMSAISCTSATNCWASLSYRRVSSSNAWRPLMEHYTGGVWVLSTLAEPPDSILTPLAGVSCVNATDCVAVGAHYNGTTEQTLVEENTGSGWQIVSSPSPVRGSSSLDILYGVACVATGPCQAVGRTYDRSGGNSYTLALRS